MASDSRVRFFGRVITYDMSPRQSNAIVSNSAYKHDVVETVVHLEHEPRELQIWMPIDIDRSRVEVGEHGNEWDSRSFRNFFDCELVLICDQSGVSIVDLSPLYVVSQKPCGFSGNRFAAGSWPRVK